MAHVFKVNYPLEWKDPGTDFRIKPGMLLALNDGSFKIVGDVNSQGGICSCCRMVETEINLETKFPMGNPQTVRYAQLIEVEEHTR